MSPAVATSVSPGERLEALFDRLAELTGQRNAIDGRIVDVVAEIDREDLCGMTGAKSVPALVAWKTGVSPRNAETMVAVARRSAEYPRCTAGLRDGRVSLDQVGVIAEQAADGSDEHYAPLVEVATVTQLRTAVKLEPRPPQPTPDPKRSIGKASDETSCTWRITLPHDEAAVVDAALASHLDRLVTEWKDDHADGADDRSDGAGGAPPMPSTVDAFLALVAAGWDSEVAARPHGQRTTVVVHVDVDRRVGSLHLGPVLSDADRQFLTCDATWEAWFERDGRPIGCGRESRQISRRLRRALEHRDRCCVVPGCGATRGLHAHHVVHWEDGGTTDLTNLVLVCPYHHRAHHRGLITISGPAERLVVTDADGTALHDRALARTPTTPPPDVPPCPGPTGERAQWWWYDPFQPQPPPTTN
ncbi:HNH endonuclease signature motif containing protein [Mycolicibacterium grossiae]|uniref:HNH nuclease domain-containing protein n=1 Tax=Mycolicibacterium grossiae TaxID=1552759 RepID=A0A1E8Q031_9MYCO|nr:HNH endonuclease signature motif containing protein [Mycolicibacterium grossiae]OFJ51731.1 hypothetical protein BEL07_21120 [Mycolicibacterium grossiae]QEM47649.1 DUF222 domain-containing protein [Mycolicibacterium grossiae]